VTCALGVLNPGTNATVAMVVAVSAAGSLTNTATATNDQGDSVNASATTQVNAAATTTTPLAPGRCVHTGPGYFSRSRMIQPGESSRIV
jgi:hypothetical protein